MYRILFLFATILSVIDINYSTPLDDYVNTPDPAFAWTLIQTYPSPTYTVYVLNMTSQRWFDSSFSTRSIWWHYMIITVPKTIIRPRNALLFIGSGSNNDPVPTQSSTTAFVSTIGSIAVEVAQVPNQPIQFMADPLKLNRSEDAVIAWLWKTFIETNGSDPHMLPRLPMTKAALRAMDATQQFLRQQEIQVPEKFVVAGISKRGWTSWLTAAVDSSRIIGAMPIVLDKVNLRQHLKNHYRSLAGWSFSINDSYVENITRYLDNPYFQTIADIVDPYSYFDRYHNVKLIQFQAADDRNFPPDSEDFFWDDLQKATGGSYLRRIPNVDHSISGYQGSLESFYISVCDQQILPSWTWVRTINQTHGQIQANVSTASGHPPPINVTVYQARTVAGTKRDFRLVKLDSSTGKVVPNPIVWIEMKDIEITKMDEFIIYTYVAPMPPAEQWDGIFMQATFPGPQNTTLTLTTETLIMPNTYPLAPCIAEQCYGTLV